MANLEIKLKAAGAGVKLWQIAQRLGITDSTLSRKLRFELPNEEKKRLLSIVDDLSKGERP